MKKITKLSLGALLVCALVMGACAGGAAAQNSRSSLDWAGSYTGQIPSASGMGIEVQLTLNSNSTFVLHYHYVGRADPDYRTTGNFTWDSSGTVITLDSGTGPSRYQLGENTLRQLDLEGRVITGDLAEMYVLRKE